MILIFTPASSQNFFYCLKTILVSDEWLQILVFDVLSPAVCPMFRTQRMYVCKIGFIFFSYLKFLCDLLALKICIRKSIVPFLNLILSYSALRIINTSLPFTHVNARSIVLALDSFWTALWWDGDKVCRLRLPREAVGIQHVQTEMCGAVDRCTLHPCLATHTVSCASVMELLSC